MSARPKRVRGTRFAEVWLADLANAGDAPADQVIGRLCADVPNTADARQREFPAVVREIARDVDDRALDDPVSRFLLGGHALDGHIDADKVHKAQLFFEDQGVAIITALFHAALPEAYLGRRGVQALDMTGELVSNWARRIQETGQFLVNVLTPTPDVGKRDKTSLSAGEPGAIAVRRVRLTHAAVRWLLEAPNATRFATLKHENVEPDTAWARRMVDIGEEVPDSKGNQVVKTRPVNQEDLLATLGTFTTVTFDALAKFAVKATDEHRDAYYHLWNVVAWHLGIGDEASVAAPDTVATEPWSGNNILPLSVGELDCLYRWLSEDLQHSTSQGCRLTKTLVQELALPLPRPLERMPGAVARYLIGDDKADRLQIERGGYIELLTVRTRMLQRLAARSTRLPVGPKLMSATGQALTRYALREFVSRSRGSDRGLRIDPATAARWGVQLGPELRSLRRV